MSISVQWQQLSPKPDPQHGTPCARSSHGVSYVNNRLVVYGGEHVARTPLLDTQALWVCDTHHQWHCIHNNNNNNNNNKTPPPRIAHAQAVHNHNVYIFGGRAGIAMQEQAMNDLWKLDCSGPVGSEQWTQITTTNTAQAPPSRSFHRMLCIQDALYVFGGCGVNGRLNDLYRFDLKTNTWDKCPTAHVTGRGGPNVLPLHNGTRLGVLAGFCGHETNDGQVYDTVQQQWFSAVTLAEMRPRSVCVAGAFPALGVALVFGGEVDPSDRGHEGAGGFANDLVVLNESTGAFVETIAAEDNDWPETRGWSAGDVHQNALYVFGGLSGDDTNPRRLDDLWKLEISKE